jgi:hypothetical protein
MKSIRNILVYCFLILFLTNCQKNSTDAKGSTTQASSKNDFNIQGELFAGSNVNFSTYSVGDKYEWFINIGDGSIIRKYEKNTSYTFNSPGTFSVKLLIYTGNKKDSVIKTIVIKENDFPVSIKILSTDINSQPPRSTTPDNKDQIFFHTGNDIYIAIIDVPSSSIIPSYTFDIDYGDGIIETISSVKLRGYSPVSGIGILHKYYSNGLFNIKVTAKKSGVKVSESSKEIEIFTIGQLKYGGAVCHIFSDNTALIISSSDLATNLNWGCINVDNQIKDTTLFNGNLNTLNIISKCGTNTVAGFCKSLDIGGYKDWFLPNVVEMRLALNKSNKLPNFKSPTGYYFTSNEFDANNFILYQSFKNNKWNYEVISKNSNAPDVKLRAMRIQKR